jgi:hypothetical protein
MGLTKGERATLKDLSDRAKAEEEQEGSATLTIRKEGHEVVLTGRDAVRMRKKLGLADLADDEEEEGEEEEKNKKGGPQEKAGYFGSKRG